MRFVEPIPRWPLELVARGYPQGPKASGLWPQALGLRPKALGQWEAGALTGPLRGTTRTRGGPVVPASVNETHTPRRASWRFTFMKCELLPLLRDSSVAAIEYDTMYTSKILYGKTVLRAP